MFGRPPRVNRERVMVMGQSPLDDETYDTDTYVVGPFRLVVEFIGFPIELYVEKFSGLNFGRQAGASE